MVGLCYVNQHALLLPLRFYIDASGAFAELILMVAEQFGKQETS